MFEGVGGGRQVRCRAYRPNDGGGGRWIGGGRMGKGDGKGTYVDG